MSPEFVVAICYVEKGKKYGDVDLTERAAIMAKHFPGDVYFKLYGFFLL